MNKFLIEPDFLEQLEHFIIASRRSYPGLNVRATSRLRQGRSSEFSDYRMYSAGDDLRYVDWKVYGRLERLFLKLFPDEEEIDVHLLLDTSASMSIGEPPKIHLAVKLAAALALTGLLNHQRVGLAFLDPSAMVFIPPGRGKIHRQHLFRMLFDCRADGLGDLADSLYKYAGYCKRSGLAIVISDLLCQRGIERELDLLRSKKLDIFLLQILARQEMEPVLMEPVILLEVESGKKMVMQNRVEQLESYRKKLHDFNESLKVSCYIRKINLLRLLNDETLDQAIFYLAGQGLLQKR